MSFYVLINGVDKSSLIKRDSLSIPDRLNQRTQCSFQMTGYAADRPKVGQEVIIYDSPAQNEKYFAGTIDGLVEEEHGPKLLWEIECVGYEQILDRFVVPETYENINAGAIAKDIVDNFIPAEEGITYFADVTDTDDDQTDFSQGTLTDVVATANGLELENGYALSFDGVDDYVSISNWLSGLNEFTFEIKVKADTFNGEDKVIAGCWGGVQNQFLLYYDVEYNSWRALFYDSLGNRIDTGFVGSPVTGQDIHIAVKYSASSDFVLLIDGEEIARVATNGNPIITSSDNFYLGHDEAISHGDWDGLIYEARCWNIARYNSDIQADMDKELTGSETGLLHYYKIDEGSGSTAIDSAGNNDGTIYGATWDTTSYYKYSGSRLSPTLDLSPVGTAKGSTISWTETLNGQSITVETNLSLDGGSTWQGWQVVSNGGSIPGISDGTDLSNAQLQVRQTLSTTDTTVTPQLNSLTVTVNSYATIEDGPTIEQAIFGYDVSARRAMDRLSDITNYVWYVDFNKMLHFHQKITNKAPWSIDDASTNIYNFRVETTRDDYRNQQYIRAGEGISDPVTERFTGDGERKTFHVGRKIASLGTVKVNGVEKTKGIHQVDSGKDFYWNKGETHVIQDDGGTTLTSADVLEVTYQYFYPIRIFVESATKITERQSVEGGSGIYMNVVDRPQINDIDAAKQEAIGLLDKYDIPEKIHFLTFDSGLKAGQLIDITRSKHGIDGQYLISDVTFRPVGWNNGLVYAYEVTALSGTNVGGWTDFFRRMAEQSKRYIIRENEVVVIVAFFEKEWQQDEKPNIFAELYPSADLYPAADLYPMFETADRVKYISILDENGAEVARYTPTKQTPLTDDEITTTLYIPAGEATGTIHSFAWYGGHMATSSTGTGIQIDKQDYGKDKGDSEALYIEKKDKKGW